jgi:hypothetical protein
MAKSVYRFSTLISRRTKISASKIAGGRRRSCQHRP